MFKSATGGLWDPMRCPVGPSKVVPVKMTMLCTGQVLALQVTLRTCGAHKKNLKNNIKLGQGRQAGSESMSKSLR